MSDKLANFPFIARYLHSPIVDVSGGESFTKNAIMCPESQLVAFKPYGIRTLIGYRWDRKETIAEIWNKIAESGYVVFKEISDEILSSLQRVGCYKILAEKPMWVLQKLGRRPGFIPLQEKKDDRKRVLIIRWGAYGDMIYITPVIEHFKKEGWHVTLCVTERGHTVYKNDPRIDDVMFLESGVAPDKIDTMGPFLDELGKNYDKTINLSAIIEQTLLPREGYDRLYGLDYAIRQQLCNKNYFDVHFERAGLDILPGAKPKVWLSDPEISFGFREVGIAKKTLKKTFIVLWNVMGSSFHKMYPWMYDVWAMVDAHGDDMGFITVSEIMGKVLEDKRFKCVLRRSGMYGVRNTLGLHNAVNGVFTTETLSLVAGLAFKAPVIALLSHSSPSQYNWKENDIPIVPNVADCPCYPCHQIHYTRISCPRGKIEKSATLCMDSIDPVIVYEALKKIREDAR